jgi:hypothetical protein
MNRTYMYKLAVLLANEEKIKIKDPNLQRLTDTQQSYYMYDSAEYHRAGLVLHRIDRELLELKYIEEDKPLYC